VRFPARNSATIKPGRLRQRRRNGGSGSLWFIHGMGPVFRFGRNPTLRLFLSRKIADMGIRAMARNYSNEPSTVLGHFGMKFRLLSHLANMRR
jgi:hypothetical protein